MAVVGLRGETPNSLATKTGLATWAGGVRNGGRGKVSIFLFYFIFVPYLHDLVYGAVVPDVGLSTAATTPSPAAAITANSLL